MAVRDAKNPTRTADDSGDRGGGIRGGGNPYRQGGGGSTLNNPGLPPGGNVTSKGPYGGSNKEKKSSDKDVAPKKSLIDRVLDEFEKARKEGNEANEKRYQEILDDFDQLATDQQDRLTELDKRFGGVAEELMETSGDVGKKIKDIASGAIGVATDKGEKRVSDIGGRYDRAGTKLGDLSDKARRQMVEAGETERKGVLGRAGEALGRLRGDYGKLADKSDVRRGEAGEDIRGGFEGQQAEQRGGFRGQQAEQRGGFAEQQAEQRGGYQAAREDVAGLYGEGRERVRSDYDRGVSEAGERFKGGRGDVGEGYREAGERAGDIGGGLADRISGMSAKSLRDLVSSAEGRLGDLGEGYRDVGRGQEERIARSRGEAGEIIGGERERQQGEFARGGAESEGRFGRGRERVREEYERGAEEAGGRYAERGEEGRSLLRGLGETARGKIKDRFDRIRTERLGSSEQDYIGRGLGNLTIRGSRQDRLKADLDKAEEQAYGDLNEKLRREQEAAFRGYSGDELAVRDRLQASGLGAGAQLTGAELGAQEGRESQRAARSGQLGQTAIGADLAAAQRGEAAAQQAGMAGAGQDIAGQTQISQLEQLLGREGLGRTIGALSQGAGTQLGLLGQGAGAGANVTGAGLSAQQNLANQGLAAGTGMTQGQISALQQLIGNQLGAQQQTALTGLGAQQQTALRGLGAQQQTALTGLGTQAQMAQNRAAAGEQLGLAGLGQQAAGNQALLGADRAIGAQFAAAQLGQDAERVRQQAALTGQGLGEQGAAERQLTGLEGQGAFQGAGAGYGNLSQTQALLAQLRANQLAAKESGNIGLTGTQLAESGVKERKFEDIPSLQDAAMLALGFGAAGGGVNMGGGMLGGGGMPSTGGGFANVEDTVSLRDKPKPVSDDKEGGDGKTPMEKIRDAVGGEGGGFDIPGGGGPGSAGPPVQPPGQPPTQPPTQPPVQPPTQPPTKPTFPGGENTAPPIDPMLPDPFAPDYPHSKILPDGTQVFSQPDGSYSPDRPTKDRAGNPIPENQNIPVHGEQPGPPVQDGKPKPDDKTPPFFKPGMPEPPPGTDVRGTGEGGRYPVPGDPGFEPGQSPFKPLKYGEDPPPGSMTPEDMSQTITNPDGSTTTTTYWGTVTERDPDGNKTSTTSNDGANTVFHPDGSQTKTSSDGRVINQNADGQTTSVIEPDGSSTHYTPKPFGEDQVPPRYYDGQGNVTEGPPDGAGQPDKSGDPDDAQRPNEYYGDWQERLRIKRLEEKTEKQDAAIESRRQQLRDAGYSDAEIDDMKYDPMKGDRDPNKPSPNEGEVLGPDGRPMIYDEIGDRWTAATTDDANTTPPPRHAWGDESNYEKWYMENMDPMLGSGEDIARTPGFGETVLGNIGEATGFDKFEDLGKSVGGFGDRVASGVGQYFVDSAGNAIDAAGRAVDAVTNQISGAERFLFDPTITQSGNTTAADMLYDQFGPPPDPKSVQEAFPLIYPQPWQQDTQNDRNEMTHPAMYPGDNVGGGMGFGAGSEGGMQGGGGAQTTGIVRGDNIGGGGGLVAGGGGGFESDFTGRPTLGGGRNMVGLGQGGYVNPSSVLGRGGATGGARDQTEANRKRKELADVAKKATQPQGPGMWMDNPSAPGGRSWVGADFSSQPAAPQQGGGALRDLAGAASDASQFGGSWQNGTWTPVSPVAPSQPGNQSVVSRAAPTRPFTDLKLLANQSKKLPRKTLAQTYRPTKYGVQT